MSIPGRGAGTGNDPPEGVAVRRLAESSGSSGSRCCLRVRGWLGRRTVGVRPVGSATGCGNRSLLQLRHTGLRLGRSDAWQSGRLKHPPRSTCPWGLERLASCSPASARAPRNEPRPRRASLMSRRLPPGYGKPGCHHPHCRARPAPRAGVVRTQRFEPLHCRDGRCGALRSCPEYFARFLGLSKSSPPPSAAMRRAY